MEYKSKILSMLIVSAMLFGAINTTAVTEDLSGAQTVILLIIALAVAVVFGTISLVIGASVLSLITSVTRFITGIFDKILKKI